MFRGTTASESYGRSRKFPPIGLPRISGCGPLALVGRT
jgi:hypothetical protein